MRARRLKILLLGINFFPELTGIGKFTGEMAAWLAGAGHEVRVITGPPYYPEWKVHQGFDAGRYRTETRQGVTVYRTPLWVPRKVTSLKRLLHLASFALASLPVLFGQWRWRPDVVWVVEPPFFCVPATLVFARLANAKAWLHVQDYEVHAAFELGLLRGSRLRKWVMGVEGALMRRFHRVSTISAAMLALARTRGVDPGRLVSCPNWVDIGAIRPLTSRAAFRDELHIATETVVALYSGNMGAKQGLETLAAVAALLRDDPGIVFVFCGDGVGKDDLATRCLGLPNVRFLPLQPTARLNELLCFADIHLLPQRAGAAELVMPSKLTGMLASGRPVIATAAAKTELAEVVAVQAACGLVTPPENAHAMSDAVRRLARDPALRSRFGANGRAYAERWLDREAVMRQLESDLLACLDAPR